MANSAVVGNLRVLLSLDSSNFDKGTTASAQNVKKLADRFDKDLIPSQQKINALIRDFVGNREIAKAMEYATAMEAVSGKVKLTAEHQTKANKAFKEAGEHLRAAGLGSSDLAQKFRTLESQTKSTTTQTRNLDTSVGSLISKAKGLAGLFGVSISVGALIGFTKSVFDAADQVGDLAQKMGVSTEAAQRFQFAAEQSGANIEDVSRAIVAMNGNLAEGGKSTVSALKAAGISFADIRAKKPEDAFRSIADAIGRIPDPMLQSRVAMELFGKAGAELLPMIRERSLQAADGAEIMKDETVQALKEAKQAWENFWLDLRVIAAEFFAGEIGQQLKQFLSDLKEGLRFINNLVNARGSVAPFAQALAMSTAQHFADEKVNQQNTPMARLQRSLSDPAAMSSHGPKISFLTKEEQDALDKANKEAAERIKKLQDSFTGKDREKKLAEISKAIKGISDTSIITGKDLRDLQKQLDELADSGITLDKKLSELRFRDRFVDFTAESSKGLKELGEQMSALFSAKPKTGFVDFFEEPSMSMRQFAMDVRELFDVFNVKPLMPVDFTAELTQTQQSIASSIGAIWDDANRRLHGGLKIGESIKDGVTQSIRDLPQVIIQTFMGGGNVAKSIGSTLGVGLFGGLAGKLDGDMFTSGLGKKLQGMFGKSFGGAIANIIPGLGALLGPALEKVFSVIGNIGANSTKKVRDQFAKDAGFQSLDNLYAKLKTLGAQGEQLANIGLNVIGKKDKAANEKWMKDVTAFFDRLEKVPGKVQELSSALGKFGGAIPSQLDPLLDSILGQSALSGDLRRQLEGMRKPSWQAAAEMASAFGVDTAALGSGFNQARLADSSFEIKRFIDLTGKLGGADQAGVLRGVADELSGLASEAMKTGVALPKAVQEFIRQVDEMGLLLDENGNRIDASLLQFADIEDEYQKQVVSILEQIRDLLAAPAVSAVPEAPTSWRAARNAPMSLPSGDSASFNDGSQWAADTSMLPGFAGGTHGQYMDFGPGTPVMLHGQERVMTKAEGAGSSGGTYNIYAIDAQNVKDWLRNRGGAEAIARELPGPLQRWRRA